MARLQQIAPETATGKTKELFDGLKAALGVVPNATKVMANSPAVLDAYVQFNGALGKAELPLGVRHQIGLAVGSANGCAYCVAVNHALGQAAGLTAEQSADARKGTAADPKTDALVRFARKVVDSRGKVTDLDIQGVRAAGWGDAAIAEAVAFAAVNVFTNFINNVAETELDFPAAPAA